MEELSSTQTTEEVEALLLPLSSQEYKGLQLASEEPTFWDFSRRVRRRMTGVR